MRYVMTIKKGYLILFSVLILLLLYFGLLLGRYSITEELAIRYSFPNQSGEKVFEKEFGRKKVVVWDTGTVSFAKLINKDWGILYSLRDSAEISVITPGEKMKFAWSATLQDEKYYDTLFAVEVLDTQIVKVVVSNEGSNENELSLSEIKEQSTVYIEMDLTNGYAAHYSYLSTSDVGGFVFRGLNSEGKVISVQ